MDQKIPVSPNISMNQLRIPVSPNVGMNQIIPVSPNVGLERRLSVVSIVSTGTVDSIGNTLFDSDGFSPIHQAAATNNINKVRKYLITSSNTDLVTKDKNRMTPLMVAARCGSLEAFGVLLAAGASLNKKSAAGLTALQYAASCLHTNIFLRLSDSELLIAFEQILEYLSTFPDPDLLYNGLKVFDNLLTAKVCTDTENSRSKMRQERILKANGIQVLSDLAEKCTQSEVLIELVGPVGVQIIDKMTCCSMIVKAILQSQIPQGVVAVMHTNLVTLKSALSILRKLEPNGYELFLKLGTPQVLVNAAIESFNEEEQIVAAEGLYKYGKMRPVAQAYYDLGFLKVCLHLLNRLFVNNSLLLLTLKLVEFMAELSEETLRNVIDLGFTSAVLKHFDNPSMKVTIQVVSLLKLLSSANQNANGILKKSNRTLCRFIYVAQNYLNQDTKNKLVEILWALTDGCEKEQRGLAGLLGPECIIRVLSVTTGDLQLITITLLRLISPAVYELQEDILNADGIITILKLIRLGCGEIQLEALKTLENLSFDIAMRANKLTQRSVQESEGLQLLLRLHSFAQDKKLKAQVCCTMAAVAIGNLSIKEMILYNSRFSLREWIEEISKSSTDKEVRLPIMRAITYFAYGSIEAQIKLCQVMKIPIKPFKKSMRSKDKNVSSLAAFQLIALMRVLDTEEDKSFLVAKCMRFLFDELESAIQEEKLMFQVHICALLSSTLHIRAGLPGAVLASGVVSLFIQLLSSHVEPCRRTAAIVLSYLTLIPQGSRMILGYCRKKPTLFSLLKKYSNGYTLSKKFLEGWAHYRTTHLKPNSCFLSKESQIVSAPLVEAKLFGCYDGRLYAFCVDSGQLHWVFDTAPKKQTEGSPLPIKSSPCVDPTTGWVWFGSHDHHMYAVDIQAKSIVHKVYPGGGSCFASPCADSASGLVYGATLRGNIVAISSETGEVEWSTQCSRPVFSSPSVYQDRKTGCSHVLAGCVDGRVYVIEEGGKMTKSLVTGNSVFSNCCIAECAEQLRIICGSHDKYLHCWNDSYTEEWKVKLDSELYSTPCPLTLNFTTPRPHYKEPPTELSMGIQTPAVCVCSSAGFVYIVNMQTGDVIGTFQLPGAVFSSPVCFEQWIVVGCRNDYVYCIDIETIQNE